MSGNYGDLSEAEQAHWNEYTTLRQLSDWPGFDAAQDQRRADARQWIVDRREYLVELANGEVEGEPAGWEINHRKERYDFLGTFNSGAPKHEVRLPCSGTATDAEKVYVEEREGYLAFGSTTEAQKARKIANLNWLQERRKSLWHLMRDDADGNEANDRQTRYENLCIATSHGEPYENWVATHNKWGEPISSGTSGSARSRCKDWLDSYVGVAENPQGSNKGSPQTASRGAPASPSARRGTTRSRARAPRASTTTPSWPRRARASTAATRPTRASCTRAITPSSQTTTPA
jgi:hypothetical protein